MESPDAEQKLEGGVEKNTVAAMVLGVGVLHSSVYQT